MKQGLLKNLSVNTLQLIVNQLLGLVIFYILSTGLDKNTFGQLNLVLAVLLAAFNILSMGIDQLIVKKIAAGGDVSSLLSLYFLHVLFAGIAFYGLLCLGSLFLPHAHSLYTLLLLIGAGKLMIFFSAPFKQAANGMERFRLLAYMLVISNFVRSCGLIFLALTHGIGINHVVIIFISGDIGELLIGVLLFKRATKITFKLQWNATAYKQLLRESLPQTGVVLITSALARFDWIFIGFMVSAVKLAEYSFAYKVFEMSTLPLLSIAPLLIPLFTKMFQHADIPINKLKLLIRAEMMIAALTSLVLNICWAPIIDRITANKYGMSNVNTIFILSLCIPLLYLNNFLWTIYFAQGKLKMILTSFIITFSVNVAGDVALIPFLKNEGAAIAFFAACLVQSVYFIKQNDIPQFNNIWRPVAFCTICALISGFVFRFFFNYSWSSFPLSIMLYFFLLYITGQIRLADLSEALIFN